MKEKPLPPSWSWVKLGEICKKVEKVRNPNEDEQFSYLDIGGINNHSNKVESFKQYKWKNAPSRAKQIVQSDDILFSTVRTYLKNIARVPKSSELQIASTGFCVIRPDLYRVVSDYVFYFTLSKDFLERLNTLQTGSSYPAVRDRDVFNQKIPLPPLQEQHRIVEKIEELFSELDNGIENLRKAKAQIKTYRQAVLKFAFEGKLVQGKGQNAKGKGENGELPEGWEWVELENLTTKLGDGLHGTPNYSDEGEYFFINGNNLSDGKIEIKENTKRVTKVEFEKYKKPLNESTVFVSINGTLGKTAFYNGEKIILGKSACYFNVSEKLNKQFIRYFLKSQQFLNYANKIATGSTIKNVSLKAMRELLLPLPHDIFVQTQIVEEIERRFSVADKMEAAIDESLKKSEALRQSILKQAFEGKLC